MNSFKDFKYEYYRSEQSTIDVPHDGCRVIYVPTNQSVECSSEPTIYKNRLKALRELWDEVLGFDPILLKT